MSRSLRPHEAGFDTSLPLLLNLLRIDTRRASFDKPLLIPHSGTQDNASLAERYSTTREG